MYHRSVLLNESIEGLRINPEGIYVDATFGGGGHSLAILAKLKNGRLFAFDQDAEAIENKPDDPRVTLIHGNFRFIRNFLKFHKVVPVDGILADLGISSHQIDNPGRGFSTRFDGDLDMRMDQQKDLSAKVVINQYPEEKLRMILQTLGEVPNVSRIVKEIISARKAKPVATTQELKEIVASCAPRGQENKFCAQVFQAIRMEVNQEIEALKELLSTGLTVLKPGGRFVVISYHSGEDKLVKNFFRAGNFEGVIEKDFYGQPQVPFRLVNRKIILPGEAEISENNRARSAHLRIAEKI
jgi:16S rRNA (cytosine1402-N4)-methyltransferase